MNHHRKDELTEAFCPPMNSGHCQSGKATRIFRLKPAGRERYKSREIRKHCRHYQFPGNCFHNVSRGTLAELPRNQNMGEPSDFHWCTKRKATDSRDSPPFFFNSEKHNFSCANFFVQVSVNCDSYNVNRRASSSTWFCQMTRRQSISRLTRGVGYLRFH